MKYKQEVKILWVDDEDRSEDAKNLEHDRKGLSVKVVHPCHIQKELSKLKSNGEMPDLFLVDYFLDQVANTKNGRFEQRGLSVAGMILEIDPERPIYVVTEKCTKVNGIFISEARAAKKCFDKILTFTEVQREGHNILYYDALDYRAIRESPRQSLTVLFKLLRASADVIERLTLVLPDELRNGLSSKATTKHPEGNVLAFARWVRDFMLSIPGFLYNELYASTYMGMNIKYFKKLSSKLERARYSGIFARTNPPLWWVSELNDIVFSNPKAQKTDKTNPWEVAPIIFRVPKEGQAKCAVCGGLFPETVGINLINDKDLRSIHYRCSIPHPRRKRVLYFDELREFEVKNSS